MLHSHVDTHAVLLPQDILDVLSAFGGSDPAADITDDGTVNVNDLLGLLSKFGTECTVAVQAPGPGVEVNCCGGGSGARDNAPNSTP